MFGIVAETGDLFVVRVSERRPVSTRLRSIHSWTSLTLFAQQQPEPLKEFK